jgi:hypothetical protein
MATTPRRFPISSLIIAFPANCTDAACEAIFGNYSVDTDVFIGGYYDDVLVRTQQGWKFAKRRVTLLWRQALPSGNPMSAHWVPELAVLAKTSSMARSPENVR